MASKSARGFWGRVLDSVSDFLPTSIKGSDELATYTAGLFGLCVILVGIGFLAIFAALFLRTAVPLGASAFVVALLSALMCLSVGAIAGLLFGIPRYSKSEVDNAVAPNNNLEQISDWLTKMIVGIGLVQFEQIVAKTKVLAVQVTRGMTGCQPLAACQENYAIGLAVVGFFTAAGFLMMYLWARVYLLLDVRSVQTRIDRDAATFRDVLNNPERIQGKQRHRDRARKAAEAGSAAMHLTEGAEIKPGADADDPWKGVFGGKSRDDANARELSAAIEPLERPKDYCSIRLAVRSTDPAKPLNGEVRFFLHDTFPQPIQTVQAKANKAELELMAWGGFTVGVLADGGKTKLELDLSQIESAPADWRAR